MKRHYIKPLMEAVEINSGRQILSDSTRGINTNEKFIYGGRGGGALPMSKDDDSDDTLF